MASRQVYTVLLALTAVGTAYQPALALAAAVLGSLLAWDAWLSRSEEKYGERLKALETLTERVEKVEKQATEDHLLLVRTANKTPGR